MRSVKFPVSAGRINQAGRRVERGMNVATTLAFAGSAAETTAAIFIVLQSVAGDACAVLRERPAHFLQALLEREFRTVELGRTLKNAVGKIGEVFLYARNAEIQIHLVVIRSEIAVADRPVFAESIPTLGLEIVVGKPERQTSPDIGLATQATRPNPGVVRAGEWIFTLIDHNILHIVGAADIAVKVLGLFKPRPYGGLRMVYSLNVKRMAVRRKFASIGIVVGPFHRPQFLLDGEFFPRLEHQNLQAVAGQDMCRHPASSA